MLTVFAPGISVEVFDRPPPPPPAPAPPAPTPPAPAPSPTAAPVLERQLMNTSRCVVIDTWHGASRYERFQKLVVLAEPTAEISFHGENFDGGGLLQALLSTEYTLLVDGVQKATAQPAGASRGEFVLDVAALEPGWRWIQIGGLAAGETSPRWAVHVGPEPVPGDGVPVASGSYDIAHHHTEHFYGMIPAGTAPLAIPLVPGVCPAFAEALPRTQLFRENIVPVREGNIRRVNVDANGVQSTCNEQSYFYSDLIRKFPVIPLLDGPRNVGTLAMPTTVLVTRQGGAYFSDPWRVGRVRPDGTVITRAGYRHKHPPSYWDGPQDLELVGDWSAIPVERHGFHEIWGITWDQASLLLDPNALPIDGEQPHVAGPRLFVADTQNNRVCLLTFDRNSVEAEPVVTEFLTGLADPWDVACVDGVLYVTERMSHRIAAYDATSGALIRVVVSGAALASISTMRDVIRNASLDTIRAEACVAPEGLFHQDGWLYFGAKANGQVRRVHLQTGAVEVVCAPLIDTNSRFIKIAVSDGTFGPRGTVFSWTWSNAKYGMPQAHLPGGTVWTIALFANISRGKGGNWESLGYGSAGGIGLGRLLCGSSEEGLVQISKALPTDVTPTAADLAKYAAGADEFQQAGDNLTHGHHGFGHHGFGLPWGKSENIDFYLAWQGHTP